MKKFFEGLGNLISRHKLLSAIVFLAMVVIVIMMYVFFNLFIGGSNKYGDRLNGIESHEISTSKQKKIASSIEDNNEVDDASVRIQGKIIYINIVFNRDVTLDKAKEIASASLSEIDDDDKKYYDIGYYLTQVKGEDENDKGFVVTGNKSKEIDNISWIKS